MSLHEIVIVRVRAPYQPNSYLGTAYDSEARCSCGWKHYRDHFDGPSHETMILKHKIEVLLAEAGIEFKISAL